MTLQEMKNRPSQIFPMELKIYIPWVANYGLGTRSSNFALNEFVNVKSTNY